MKLYPFFLGILLLTACSKDIHHEDNRVYYDFQTYFSEEIGRLSNDSNLVITKNVTLNKVTEQKNFYNVNWNSELSLFKKIAIKPVNWQNGFILDSMVKVDAVLSAIYYSSIDPKQEIKQIILTDTMHWIKDSIDYPYLNSPFQLLFNIENKNAITHTSKKLVYQPSKGFLISGFQKTKWIKKTDYTIRAWWLMQ
jgi:hypothetical protein